MKSVSITKSLGEGWSQLKSSYGTLLKMTILPYLPFILLIYVIDNTLTTGDFIASNSLVREMIKIIFESIASIFLQLIFIGIFYSLYDWHRNKKIKPKLSGAFQAFTNPIFVRVIPFVLLTSFLIFLMSFIGLIFNSVSIFSLGSVNPLLLILFSILNLILSFAFLLFTIIIYGVYILIKKDLKSKPKSFGTYFSNAWNELGSNKWLAIGEIIVIGIMVTIISQLLVILFLAIVINMTSTSGDGDPWGFWKIDRFFNSPGWSVVTPMIFIIFVLSVFLIVPLLESAIAAFYSKALPDKKPAARKH